MMDLQTWLFDTFITVCSRSITSKIRSYSLIAFQNAIAMHESNGIDIIIALLLSEINPLGKNRMELVLELKVTLSE